ncbi:MAG: phytanoyl-CoA dioxygenase family protein [Streptosporangiales bacterium]|nr:phytanoyl-CoA dioxygenase family protein [Streptosporangiales bacterium]
MESRTARDRYERDGYLIWRSAIDADLVAEAAGHVEWLQGRHPELRGEDLGHTLMTHDPFWVRLAGDDRLLDIAEIFVGPDIALFASHYICKPPYTGRPVLWHQDGAFWPLEPMEVVTLWLAVDPSTRENGCLRVLPGSHREPLHGLRAAGDVDDVLGSETDADLDVSAAVDLELSPGDVEIHHPSIVHGSEANASPHRRCGLTLRYIPTTTRITDPESPYPSAFHLRGAPGVNPCQPRPHYVPGEHHPFAGCEAWR